MTRSTSKHQPDPTPAHSITHGQYFLAARAFLEGNGFETLLTALSQVSGPSSRLQDISEIRVIIVKHGEFYHPARIEVLVSGEPVLFVLNLAVSRTGMDFIEKEYQTLRMLTNDFTVSYVPQVFAYGDIPLENGRVVSMFLGQWLDRYHEFHISADPSDRSGNIKVWDSENGVFFLTGQQVSELYTRAAEVLTHYYDPVSFRQVFPWHHAAGDFIVKADADFLDVKLVTVRGYEPLLKSNDQIEAGDHSVEEILQALLIFLINLSIRMRIDRLDGVGDLVWSDEVAVSGTVNGFIEVLASKPRLQLLPAPADICFIAYFSTCSQTDLLDLADAIVGTFNPQMPEIPLIKSHLQDHVEALYEALNNVVEEYTT